jgi:predicted transcriptional regulator
MMVVLWQALLIAFLVGLTAALVSQFASTRRATEAGAKARTLRENIIGLVNRNSKRRDNLEKRREVLDRYLMMDIEHKRDQLDDRAIIDAIDEEKKRIADLKEAIAGSEEIIVEYRKVLAEVDITKARGAVWLLLPSGIVGGVTALVFGFMGFLGLEGLASDAPVQLTTSLFVQSIGLGAGWPLVWKKILSEDKLEAVASTAVVNFQQAIKNVEKEEV